MAPLRIDIGSISADSDLGLLNGAEVSVGIHWASLSPQPTNLDIGLGVFGGAAPAAPECSPLASQAPGQAGWPANIKRKQTVVFRAECGLPVWKDVSCRIAP